MSVVFLLVLISAFSYYLISVNDQLGYGYDTIVQMEKKLISSYELEFVICYVHSFYRLHYKELVLPYSASFNVLLSSEKKLSFSVVFAEKEARIEALVSLFADDLLNNQRVVCCNFEIHDNEVYLRDYSFK